MEMEAMRHRNGRVALRALLISGLMLAAAACGDSSDGSSGGSAGSSGSAGAAGAGGIAGGGGAASFAARRCGSDVPCEAGSSCEESLWETRRGCECDPSGHMLCDLLQGGAAGPSYVCLPGESCPLQGAGASGNECETSNGFCTRSCTCTGGELDCTVDCTGSGPESEGTACAPESCNTDVSGGVSEYYGGCEYDAPGCKYSVSCTDPPVVSGDCE